MKTLPNNCRYGKIGVFPSNWKDNDNELLKVRWRVLFRFYDDNVKKTKQIACEDFNRYSVLSERQKAVERYIKGIRHDYEVLGYNPIAESTQLPISVDENQEVSRWTKFIPALRYAASKKRVSENTMNGETLWIINQLEMAAKALRFDNLNIWEVTLKHLFLICEQASYRDKKNGGGYSGDKFNRNKKVLRELYKKLLVFEVVQANFPMSLERQKGSAKKKKVVLTKDERVKLVEYLGEASPRFLLFIQIFFHSGSRLTEMLRVKVKDVDLSAQSVTYYVMKGREYSYKERPIKDIALQYWADAINGAKRGDYVFSNDLLPGSAQIDPNVIKKRWQRLQKKLGITASFYSLKHLNTTEMTKLVGSKNAAILNAESEEMILKHYDVERDNREHNVIKSVNNPF